MKQKKILLLVIAMLTSCILAGCMETKGTTDYSKAEHWLALPASIDKEVDVFYIYPTAWHKADKDESNICEIDNPSMLKGSKGAYNRQATAFEPVGNIYAPYYRQVDAKYYLSLPLEEQEKLISGIPKEDVFAAFDYYIKHYNNGRPFILAGHSQGSIVMLHLLSEYMKENPKVYDRMIAAYVIGYSVTDEYLSENRHLKFAEGPNDIGVIISYNTQAPTIEGTNPVVLPGAKVINPISWTTEETLATAEEGLGSTLPNKEHKFVPVGKYADARVDKTKGVLICSTADAEKLVPGNEMFPRGTYHSFDYPFYYFNIRENAANRAKIYLKALESCKEYIANSDFTNKDSIDYDKVKFETISKGLVEIEKKYSSNPDLVDDTDWFVTIGESSYLNYCILIVDSSTLKCIGYLPIN